MTICTVLVMSIHFGRSSYAKFADEMLSKGHTYLPFHMQDKRKHRGHWNAYQVERAEINGCAKLLLAAACEHAWEVETHKITTRIPQNYS